MPQQCGVCTTPANRHTITQQLNTQLHNKSIRSNPHCVIGQAFAYITNDNQNVCPVVLMWDALRKGKVMRKLTEDEKSRYWDNFWLTLWMNLFLGILLLYVMGCFDGIAFSLSVWLREFFTMQVI